MSARYRVAGVAGDGIRARSSLGGGPGPCLDDIRHAPQMRPSPGLVRTASHCGSHRPDAEGPRGGIIVARHDQSSHGTGSAGRTNGALQRFPRFIGWVCDDRESRVGSVGAGLSMVVLLAACTRSTEPAADTRSTVGPTVSAPASATAGAERGAPLDTLPFPEPAGGGLPAAQQQALRAALDQVTQPSASGVIRGVSMAVVTTNGSWAGVTGTDGDNVPLVPEAMADIASITKTVTAAEIMFLAPPLGLGGVPVPRRAPWPDGCEELRAMPRPVVESS